jgi:hypothetical protein
LPQHQGNQAGEQTCRAEDGQRCRQRWRRDALISGTTDPVTGDGACGSTPRADVETYCTARLKE